MSCVIYTFVYDKHSKRANILQNGSPKARKWAIHHDLHPNATPPPRIWQPTAAKKGAGAEKGDPRGSKEQRRGPPSFHKGALRASISTGKNCVNLTRSEKIKKQQKREITVF